MSDAVFQGQCLCAAVSVRASVSEPHVAVCHCGMCRKWGGGPFMTVEHIEKTEWQGEGHIGVYASSEWAERGFCKQCGTHLFYRLQDKSLYALPAGLFADATGGLSFTRQVFVDEKPAYYNFREDTHNLTGEEVFALFQQEG